MAKAVQVFTIAFLFHLALMVALEVVGDIFAKDNCVESLLKSWSWVFPSLMLYGCYYLLTKLNVEWGLNFDLAPMLVIKVLIFLILSLFFALVSSGQVWLWRERLSSVTLIDDSKYYDDPYADYDPLRGSSSGSYHTSFKYFIADNDNFRDIEIPEGKISFSDGKCLFKASDDVVIATNFSRAIFWKYAICIGYKPLQSKHDYSMGGFFHRLLIIGPFYLFEILLRNIEASILFALAILAAFKFRPDLLQKRNNTHDLTM